MPAEFCLKGASARYPVQGYGAGVPEWDRFRSWKTSFQLRFPGCGWREFRFPLHFDQQLVKITCHLPNRMNGERWKPGVPEHQRSALPVRLIPSLFRPWKDEIRKLRQRCTRQCCFSFSGRRSANCWRYRLLKRFHPTPSPFRLLQRRRVFLLPERFSCG